MSLYVYVLEQLNLLILIIVTAINNAKYQLESGLNHISFFGSTLLISVQIEIAFKQLSYCISRKFFGKLFYWVQELPARKFDDIFGDDPQNIIQRRRKYSALFFVIYNLDFITTATIFVFRVILGSDPGRIWQKIPFIENDNHPKWVASLHAYCFSVIGVVTPLIDCPLVIIGIQIMGFLDIINGAIQNLKKEEFVDQYHKILKNVFELHCEFIQVLNDFNNATRFACLFQFIGSMLMFLSTFSLITIYPKDVFMYQNIFCVFMQLAFFCLFGQIIEVKTDKICEELYQTNWYNFTQVDKKNLLLMLKISQRNYCMKAGGMYPINIYTLFQIIKLAVTYCTLMVTLLN
ncbi:odorant receptor 22a-like [Phlebotomus papatasi]|uniref:odorant receptor 22a-like n=1 Tax=Phlebotomus papatasi TaxID=29031 RepID=UPI002483EFFC|nr:odorant receptor 22a-like [Phlebotomus papatasi]